MNQTSRFLGLDVHAEWLARSYRFGDLTAVWVSDEGFGGAARSSAGARSS
jgi:hypothetical protein